jgi:hypothetical protein
MMISSDFGAQGLKRKTREKSKDIRILALNNYIEFVSRRCFPTNLHKL